MLIWLVVRPGCDRGVAAGAQLLVRAFEYPRVTRLLVNQGRVEIRRSDLRPGSAVPALPLSEIHFNAIVLLALYLALPGPFRRRQLERLVIGWSLLYLSQVLNLVFHVKLFYASGLGEWSRHCYSDLARHVFGFLQYFTDLPGRFSFPFLIWLGLNWDHGVRLVGVGGPSTEARSGGDERRATSASDGRGRR